MKEREKGVWGRRERETKSVKVGELEPRVAPGSKAEAAAETEPGTGPSAVAKLETGLFPAAELVLRKLTMVRPQRWLRKPFCLAAARWRELKLVVASLAKTSPHGKDRSRLHRTGRFGYTCSDSSQTANPKEDRHDASSVLLDNQKQGRRIEV